MYQKWCTRQPTPWTTDPLISQGRMCNVFRALDKETVYCARAVIEPLWKRPADLLFNLIIFRAYINWSDAMEMIGLQFIDTYDKVAFTERLVTVSDALGKVSNAAYNVGTFTAHADAAQGAGCKHHRAAAMFDELRRGLPALVRKLLQRKDSAFTFESIVDLKGVGKFIGYQICIDLGYWNREVTHWSITVGVLPLEYYRWRAHTHTRSRGHE